MQKDYTKGIEDIYSAYNQKIKMIEFQRDALLKQVSDHVIATGQLPQEKVEKINLEIREMRNYKWS
jgi:hypothetical protein